ncbi:MAG: hypothetical protein J6V72_09640 [Kiritimatiellae bacterium]|nr:hypothetical protein [Kiritimatiellia bacterium]
MRLRNLFAWAVAALACAAAGVQVVETGDVTLVGTNGLDAVQGETLLVEGTLRKVGAGTLTIPLERIWAGNGTLDVADGTVRFTRETGLLPEEVPTDVLAKAAFWVDAEVNVVTNAAGEVTTWYDVRETAADIAAGTLKYVRAEGASYYTNAATAKYPVLLATDAGRPYVQFRGYQSGAWMKWLQPGTVDTFAWLKTWNAFAVQGTYTSHGNVFGSAHRVDDKLQDFAMTSSVQYWDSLFAPITAEAHKTLEPLRVGRTFLNGLRVDADKTPQPKADTVLDFESTLRVCGAESFFNFREYQAGGIEGAGNRVGGDRLYAAAVFTNRLTDAERARVDRYLNNRWISREGRFPATIRVANGARLEVPSELAEAVGKAMGGGTVHLTDVSGTASATNVWYAAISPVAGKTYAASKTVVAISDGTPGAVTANKYVGGTPDSVLPFASIPDGATLSIGNGAIVRLVQEDQAEVPSNALHGVFAVTGNFEGYGSERAANNQLAIGATVGGWTAREGMVYIVKDGHYYSSAGAQLIPKPTPDGVSMLILKDKSAVETTFSLPAAGRYELSFLLTARFAGNGQAPVDIFVDGTNVVGLTALATPWTRYRYLLPYLVAGEHALRLQIVPTGDRTALFDDFRLDWHDAHQTVPIGNANFENVSWSTSSYHGTRFAASEVSGWTVSDSGFAGLIAYPRAPIYSNLNSSGDAQGDKSAVWQPYGMRCLLLSNGGWAKTSVTVPKTGRYMLSLAAARVSCSESPSTVSVGHLAASIGGKTNMVNVTGTNYARYEAGIWSLAAGETVELSIKVDAGGGRLSVDDVELVPYDELIVNGSFAEGPAAGFTTNGWDVVLRNAQTNERCADTVEPVIWSTISADNNEVDHNYGYFYGVTTVSGPERLRIMGNSSVAQTVHVSEPGRYRLAYHFITRYAFNAIPWGAQWGSGQNPVRASVVVGGVTNVLGTVTPLAYSTEWQRTEYDVLVPEAGDVRIVLEGRGYNGTADRTTLIDAVSFRKTSGAADWKPFGDKTKISVAAGGTLSLDYDGTFRAYSFHHAGQSYTGIIDATHESGCIKGAGRIEVLPKGTILFLK